MYRSIGTGSPSRSVGTFAGSPREYGDRIGWKSQAWGSLRFDYGRQSAIDAMPAHVSRIEYFVPTAFRSGQSDRRWKMIEIERGGDLFVDRAAVQEQNAFVFKTRNLTILFTQPRQWCEFLSQTNELPVELQKHMESSFCAQLVIQFGTQESCFVLRVRRLRLPAKSGELFPSSPAHRFHQHGVAVADERLKGRFFSVSSPMKTKGMTGKATPPRQLVPRLHRIP